MINIFFFYMQEGNKILYELLGKFSQSEGYLLLCYHHVFNQILMAERMKKTLFWVWLWQDCKCEIGASVFIRENVLKGAHSVQ